MKFKRTPQLFLCILLFTILACNIPTSQPSIPTQITSTQTIEETNTPAPSFTPQNTSTPTITFTPIAIQQLGTNNQIDFIQPLPLSTPITDPNSISGVAYNGYGPIPNADVSISKTYCGDTFQRTKTDNQGRYILTNLQAGTYYLQFDSQGTINFCGEEIIKHSGGLAKDIIRPRDDLSMIFPIDEQTVTEIRPTIEWEAVADASFYVVELTYQTSGEPGWGENWTGKFLGTWLTNQTKFTIPLNLNTKIDYKLNIIAYTAERLPLVWAFEIRFHY